MESICASHHLSENRMEMKRCVHETLPEAAYLGDGGVRIYIEDRDAIDAHGVRGSELSVRQTHACPACPRSVTVLSSLSMFRLVVYVDSFLKTQ